MQDDLDRSWLRGTSSGIGAGGTRRIFAGGGGLDSDQNKGVGMKAISEVTVKVSNGGHVNREEIRRSSVRSLSELKVKLFADGADRAQIAAAAANPLIQGFTTNPTLMRAAGVKDYETFAREALDGITHRPISFEVFADESSEMERQARKLANWAGNVYLKSPVSNTRREPCSHPLRRLPHSG